MKVKIIYTILFLLAFIVTTAGIAYVNSQFNNVFQFDFSPPKTDTPADSLKQMVEGDSLGIAPLSGKLTENFQQNSGDEINQKLQDSISTLMMELEKFKKEKMNLEKQTVQKTKQTKSNKKKNDHYLNWIKKTANLYASMDSKKAAKIIQNYSDNIARDIIYAMKKKKAAEILAEMNPETATRIMRLN